MKSVIYFFVFLYLAPAFAQNNASAPVCDLDWPAECTETSVPLPDLNALFVRKQSLFESPFRYFDCESEGLELIDYANVYNFSHLVIYGVKEYITNYDPIKVGNLRKFIANAHDNGLTVSLTVGKYESAAILRTYLDDSNTATNEKYDALCISSEPWNSMPDISWDNYFASIISHRAFCNSRGILFEAYIGNPKTQYQVDLICTSAQRIYMAYYRSHPCDNGAYGNFFHFKSSRLKMFANASHAPVQISILFNANTTSIDPNMADWMQGIHAAHPNTPYTEITALPFQKWFACDNGFDYNLPIGTQDADIDFEIGADRLTVLGYSWYGYQDLRNITETVVPNNSCDNFNEQSIASRNATPTQNGEAVVEQLNGSLTITLPNDLIADREFQYMAFDLTGKVLGTGRLTEEVTYLPSPFQGNGIYYISVFDGSQQYKQVMRICQIN